MGLELKYIVKTVKHNENDHSLFINGKRYDVWFKNAVYYIETFNEDVGRASSFGGAIGKAIEHYNSWNKEEVITNNN